MKVLIAGGTGLIGSRLSVLLEEKNYSVRHLSRNQNMEARFPAYRWSPADGEIDQQALEGVDILINLAGAGIADKPWTAARKKVIIESRVKSNELLIRTMQNMEQAPKAYLAASAIGFYGDSGEELLDEERAPGSGFLSESTQAWEKAIAPAMESSIRTVAIRIGIVLSKNGGALPKILLPFLFFVGPYFGNGRQWYSWIHIDDLCRLFIYAMEKEEMAGIYNGVNSQVQRNKVFTRNIGKGLNKPFLLIPAPVFALKLLLGEMSETVLSSTKVDAKKTIDAGFEFKFEDLQMAIADIIKRKV